MIACGISRIDCPDPLVRSARLTSPATFSLTNGAWCIPNWESVLSRTNRGQSLTVPGADGRLPREIHVDQTEPSIPMAFDGNVDKAGTSYAPNTVMHGLEVNRLDFEANVVEPPATTNNLFTLELTLFNGSAVSADIQVLDFQFTHTEVEGLGRAIWSIRIPDGKFT